MTLQNGYLARTSGSVETQNITDANSANIKLVPLRVLHFLADGRVGGPQVRIVRVHEAMNRHGRRIETTIASPPTQPDNFFSKPGMVHLVLEWHKPKAERPIRSGLKWLCLGLWQDVLACRRMIRAFGGGVVHINGAILLPAALAAAIERVPWVWHFNDTSVPRFFAVLVQVIRSIGGGKAVAASGAVVRYYRLPENTTILYPPVSATSKAAVRSRENFQLGVLANLSPGKGIEDVIDAFALAHRKHPFLRLDIGGRVLENKKWYFLSLQQKVADLGIADVVNFSGFVSDPLRWMCELDMFVFSSHFEAAPVALIEALATGLPIVSGEIPPTREILGDAGLLSQLGNAADMCDKICRIVENDKLRAEFSERAYERGARVFSDDAVAQKYWSVYLEMVEESK